MDKSKSIAPRFRRLGNPGGCVCCSHARAGRGHWIFHRRPERARPRRSSPSHRAFSLVEVALSLGIAVFAIVTVFSLLPMGLSNFRQAMNTSIGSQIAQRVLNDAQQSDFDALITDYQNNTIAGTNATGLKPCRFFDDQGVEIAPTNSSAGDPRAAPSGLTDTEKRRIVYWVNTRVMPATAVPKAGTSTQDNASLATVTVQVAHNPGNLNLAFDSGSPSDQNSSLRNLWTGAYASAPTNKVVSIKSYRALVSRSK